MLKNLSAFARHQPSRAVGLAFASLSLLYGSLFARLPEIQQSLGLSQAQLGLALLGMSLGSLLITPLSTWFIDRFRVGRVTFSGTLLMCIAFIFPSYASHLFALFLALTFTGITHGLMNVVFNAAATSIEKRHERKILSTCHGMFSLGGMIGAFSAGIIAGIGVPITLHLSLLALLLILLTFYLKPIMMELPHEESSSTRFALPDRNLLGLSVISFFVIMTEVTVMDWSSIYLKNNLQSTAFITGLGFAGFSATMAIGRFYGDSFIPLIGPKRIVLGGMLLGIFGLAIVAFIPKAVVVIGGFVLTGIGFSCIVPIVFGAAARVSVKDPGKGIAAVAAAGLLGVLLGRPMAGFIAEYWGLNNSFAAIMLLVVIAALVARQVDFGLKVK